MKPKIDIITTEAGWRIHVNNAWAGGILTFIHNEPEFAGYLAVPSAIDRKSLHWDTLGEAINYLLACAKHPTGNEINWAQYTTGDRSICSQCEQPIVFDGEKFSHIGPLQPRHIALPS